MKKQTSVKTPRVTNPDATSLKNELIEQKETTTTSRPVRISLFSGLLNDPMRRTCLKDAVATASSHGAQLLVLPGYPLARKKWDGNFIQSLADNGGLDILAEKKDNICYLHRSNQAPLGPYCQKIGGTKALPIKVVRDLVDEFKNGDRTVFVGDKKAVVMLCGEVHVLQGDHPRYDVDWVAVKYDVLLNPTHKLVNHYREHWENKLDYFSRSGRWALHCANYRRNERYDWEHSICVYHDGSKIATGDFDNLTVTNHLQWWTEQDSRLLTVEIS